MSESVEFEHGDWQRRIGEAVESQVTRVPGLPEGCICDWIYVEAGQPTHRRWSWHLTIRRAACPVHTDEMMANDFTDFHAVKRKGVIACLFAVLGELSSIDEHFALFNRMREGKGLYLMDTKADVAEHLKGLEA